MSQFFLGTITGGIATIVFAVGGTILLEHLTKELPCPIKLRLAFFPRNDDDVEDLREENDYLREKAHRLYEELKDLKDIKREKSLLSALGRARGGVTTRLAEEYDGILPFGRDPSISSFNEEFPLAPTPGRHHTESPSPIRLRSHDRGNHHSNFYTPTHARMRSLRNEGEIGLGDAAQSASTPGRLHLRRTSLSPGRRSNTCAAGENRLNKQQRLEADRTRALEWAQKRKERKKV